MCNISGLRNVAQYDAMTGRELDWAFKLDVTSNIKPQTSNILKDDLEQLDALPFPFLGIDHDMLLSGAVPRSRRFRVEHLQRVIARRKCAHEHAADFFLSEWRWRRFFDGAFGVNRWRVGLRRGNGGGGRHDQHRRGQLLFHNFSLQKGAQFLAG